MTALNFILAEQYLFLVSDTLSLTNDKDSFKYVTKILMLPHLKGVICGTGSFDLILKWYETIQKKIIGRDIDILRNYSSDELEKIYFDELKAKDDHNSTIYHFGYIPGKEKFEGYVYRSKNGFAEEKLDYGLGLKPFGNEIAGYARQQIEDNLVDGLINIMCKQKELDEAQEKEEQVGIGGSIHLLEFTKTHQKLSEIYQFPDYEKKFYEMLDRQE
jgi:hypothetical protein